MDKEYMEAMARKALTNNIEGRGGYNGSNDPYVSFAKAKDFRGEKRNGMQFAFKVKNTTGEAKKLCINPANFEVIGVVSAGDGNAAAIHNHNIANLVAAGHVCDAIADNGKVIEVDATHFLEITTPKATMREMLNFVKRNPARILQIVVQANDVSFYEGALSSKDVNPFTDKGETVIPMTDSFGVMQSQDRKIVVDTDEYDLQLDDQTLLFIDVPGTAAGSDDVEAIITLKVGAVENSAKALNRKAIAAKAGF